MKRASILLCTVAMFFSWGLAYNAHCQTMIADITHDVETEFGTYHPYPAPFTPNVPAYSVEPDLSDVVNYPDLEWFFDSADSALLAQSHFVVKKSRYKQLFDVYNACTWDATPIFVTSDAVLHTYHVLFDRLLAEIEIQRFVGELDVLGETLIGQAQSVYEQSSRYQTREAARRNLAYLCVAKKLLKGDDVIVPEPVSALVDSELVLIDNQDDFYYSPIFGGFSKLDYSQFQPRGHYTKNDTLKAYFKTMMWYGWTIFTMEPELFGPLAAHHTLQALMLVQMLYNLEANGQPLLELWEDIYVPTVFFVGKTDDPNIRDYKAIADQIYGDDFLSLSADSISNSSLLDAFMIEAQKLPEPKIPNWIFETYTTYKGFRFMGQRFIPDSYMFAHLIYPYVGAPSHQRWMPKGLDIMAILGSSRAYTLLDSLYKETSYANYAEKIAEFNAEFSGKPSEDWAQNLYWNWLYCLMPLLYEKGPGYPYFMQTVAWEHKELFAALASWAELRHDTILYAKQSMSPCGIAPGPPRSYVEPNPYLYARLASLARYTREGLLSRELPIEKFVEKLKLFERLLLFLRNVSIKELENVPLSESEYQDIFCFGKVMEELVSEYKDPHNPWNSDTDDMAVVADVHTDSNTGRCLEEGVGYPLEIFVIVKEGGMIRLTRGAIFSYYEFAQPISERLTDEAWREMLVGDTPPAMPEWVSSFMDASAPALSFDPWSPENLYWEEFTGVTVEPTVSLPEKQQLLQNYPNPFNPETTIEFDLPKDSHVKLVIYNLVGQRIRTLLDAQRPAGSYTLKWDGTDSAGKIVPSGIYLCRMEAGGVMRVKKMFLLR